MSPTGCIQHVHKRYIINVGLNAGVAATKMEVRDLANAVRAWNELKVILVKVRNNTNGKSLLHHFNNALVDFIFDSHVRNRGTRYKLEDHIWDQTAV